MPFWAGVPAATHEFMGPMRRLSLAPLLLLLVRIPAVWASDEVSYAPPSAEDDAPGRLLAEKKPKRKFCNTTQYALKGDYAYEACGAFCKQAKAVNHCKCERYDLSHPPVCSY